MTRAEFLSGRLLLAMPGMFDPRFEQSVNVVCVHDEHGALAINIARVREGVTLHGVLEELGMDPGVAPDRPVLDGGPVEPGRGFILHSADWAGAGTVTVSPIGALSASLDVLRAIAAGTGPSQWQMALGYAGWTGGQLEEEMRQPGWYVADGHRDVVFDTPVGGRWMAAWRAEGIDPAMLSDTLGRA